MKSLLLFIVAATATNLVRGQEPFLCDIPENGCLNGMFNQAACACECIPPFCHDRNKECADATKTCADPWSQCTRGVDCPWWKNPQVAEKCTSGPKVPLGEYEIYNSKSICCRANFSYSTTCDAKAKTSPPTKYPTLGRGDDDNFEVVAFSMEITGLPSEIDCDALWEQMALTAKRQLLRTSDRVPGLKISSVDEKFGENCDNYQQTRRSLLRDVIQYYGVNVVRDDDKKFGPIIIQDFRDSKNEILADIQSYADTQLFRPGEDAINVNFCTTQGGQYNLCMIDKNTPPPTRKPLSPPIVMDDPDDGGLAVWVIALIIICALLLLCCIGYCVFVSFFKDYDENNEIHNNIHMGDRGRDHDDGYDDRRLAIMDGGTQASGYDDRGRMAIMDGRMDDRSQATGHISRRSVPSQRHLVLSGQEDPALGDDTFTINTNQRSVKTRGTQRSVNTRGTQRSERTHGTKHTGRDPTMYIPGQEDKPDPDSSDRSISSRSRRYLEDPPLKAKRDPTMYLEGRRDPTMYIEGQLDPTMYMEDGQYSAEDPPLKPTRDPTMYMEGQQDSSPIYVDEDTVEEVYNEDRGGVQYGGIDEDEYDNYGFKQESSYAGGSNADYSRGQRDPSFYAEEASFKTQEPSVASQSARSKKSKKSKKKKGTQSFVENEWGNSSSQDESNRSRNGEGRQTKSFYN